MRNLMKGYRRIEICGGIASGKTTLCRNLRRYVGRIEFEDFTKNPFWALFYQDPNLHSFETEVTFLLQHYSQIKCTMPSLSTVAFDYSLLQDEAYARVNLNDRALGAFEAVYEHVREELPPPVLIIHLQCTPEEELRRIRNRARSEEATIQLAYLDALNRAIAHAVEEVRGRVTITEIDSAVLNFANDPEARQRVVSKILAAAVRG